MKKILFGSLMALACVVAFTSCGSDKDEILQIIPAIINPTPTEGAQFSETANNMTLTYVEIEEGIAFTTVWSFDFDENGNCIKATISESAAGILLDTEDMTEQYAGTSKDAIRIMLKAMEARLNGNDKPVNPGVNLTPTIKDDGNYVVYSYGITQENVTVYNEMQFTFNENSICTQAVLVTSLFVPGVDTPVVETTDLDDFVGKDKATIMMTLEDIKAEQERKNAAQ